MSEVKAGEQCKAVSSDGHRCELLAIGDLGHTWHAVHFSAGMYWTAPRDERRVGRGAGADAMSHDFNPECGCDRCRYYPPSEASPALVVKGRDIVLGGRARRPTTTAESANDDKNG